MPRRRLSGTAFEHATSETAERRLVEQQERCNGSAERRSAGKTVQNFDSMPLRRTVAFMILSAWSDKGGTGKTTAAILAAAHFRARLLDLDPQGDAARWAEKGEHPYERLALGTPKTQARLIAAAESPELHVVDCPPGRDGIPGMAFAQFVIVPTRSGDADLVALARALGAIRTVQQNGNPGLEVGVVLNAIRETGRARGVSQGLRVASGYRYLGEIKERLVYEEAYSAGSGVSTLGGPAVEEVVTVMSKIAEVLFPALQHHHTAA